MNPSTSCFQFNLNITMLFSYIYGQWQNWQWWTNVPPLQAILMAMWECGCNALHIPQCSMPRATLEASGCCHWATTCSVLPQKPPGSHAKQRQWKNAPTLLVITMAMVMPHYNAACIGQGQGRTSRASLETVGCIHLASIFSNSINWSFQHIFF
jgi:hypothetical protein